MKFSTVSQLMLVSVLGLGAAALITACQVVTLDTIYVASPAGLQSSSSDGQIQIFSADSETGALRTNVPAVSSGGVNPVAFSVSSNFLNLYVANQGDSTLVHFAVNSDGSLAQKDTVTLSSQGNTPVAIAANQAGTALYVVSQYQPGCSAAKPCSGALSVFSLSSDGTIGSSASNGSLGYWPLNVPGYSTDLIVPTGIFSLASNQYVFVTAFDQSAYNPGGPTTSTANPGWVFGFAPGSGNAVAATPRSPYQAGVKPTGAAADPTNRFLYVTDFASNQLIGYSVQSLGVLSFLINGPFKTGNEPQAVTIDPRGKFIYVANALDSSVSAYSIDLSTGTPSAAVNVTGAQTNSTDTQPVSIIVDAALGRFVYTANHLGNSVSGFQLNPTAGTLSPTQATPYPSVESPNAVASVPHGTHSTQSVTP
jgi:6-phosphogluconolactonase (cycloisomerase 2 family)